MEESRNIFSQLMNAYNSLPADRKLILAVCVIVFIAAMWFWASSMGQPEYGLLYGDLNLQDSGKIVSELQNKNVPYKLADGGQDILVPADQLFQLRIDLASSDILPSGSTGFELFDKSNLGLTEFTQHVNRQRAIQGELERTLKAMEGIEFARVHLNLPEQSPFMEDVEKAKASVMVKLAPRYRTIGSEKVAAIQNLVATADGRLNPEEVSVVDSKMNVLSKSRYGEEEYADLPERIAFKQKVEAYEATKIKEFLEKSFGMGNVAVGVSIDINFDRVEKESKSYEPLAGTNKGVLSKEELEEEETKGSGSQSAQGVPGTSSNIPGYPAVEGGTYESERSHEVREYNVSEEWEHTILAPGNIEKMSISVLLNGEEEDPTRIKEVEQLVQAAANLDTTRGDKIMVTMVPFDTTYLAELEAAAAEEKGAIKWVELFKWIPAGVVFLIGLFIFMRLMKPIKEGYRVPRLEEISEEEEVELPPQDPEAMRKAKMREEITRLAERDPASAARIIKTWLSQ